MTSVFLTTIPRSGARWLRDSLEGFNKIPWLTPKDDIHIHIHGNTWGHIPPFPNVLERTKGFYRIYLRRKSIKDQITSFTHHDGLMLLPGYLKNFTPHNEIKNAIRIMARFYRYMEPWKKLVNRVLYYEDLCKDFDKAIFPLCEDLGIDHGPVVERSKKRVEQYIHLGCKGIGQHVSEWIPSDYKLYERLFRGIE